jgi:hypothetical protein
MKNKIKHIITAIALTLGLSNIANAQVTSQKIGTNPTTITPSAVLDIESANKGVLFPRVALTSTNLAGPIVSPATGLTVFNTATSGTAPNTVTPGYYYWDGSRWTKIAVETPPITFAKTVYVNAVNPNDAAATIFDEANPAITNTNTLKEDAANLYVATDGSTWTYNTVAGNYKTYAVAPSTPFNLANTTTDAGYNKTASIWRAGNIGIGTRNPTRFLDVVNTTNDYNGIIEAEGPVSNIFTRAMAIRMRRGTSAAPTAIQTNDLSAFGFAGYDGVTYSTAAAGIAGLATENWTAAAKGMALTLSTSLNGTSNAIMERMRVDHNGNVGIGTTAPTAQLEVATTGATSAIFRRGVEVAGAGTNLFIQRTQNNNPNVNSAGTATQDVIGRIIFSMANGTNYPTAGGIDIGGYYVGQQTTTNAAGGLTFRTVAPNSTVAVERMRINENGNVGIGTNSPTSRLEVNGSATNRVSHDAFSSTTIDFSQSNLARTQLDLAASGVTNFTLNGIKDGGTYTLRVRSTTAGTANFSGSGFASTAFRSPNNGVAAAGDTLYTFMVIGDRVFFYMTTGL